MMARMSLEEMVSVEEVAVEEVKGRLEKIGSQRRKMEAGNYFVDLDWVILYCAIVLMDHGSSE